MLFYIGKGKEQYISIYYMCSCGSFHEQRAVQHSLQNNCSISKNTTIKRMSKRKSTLDDVHQAGEGGLVLMVVLSVLFL
jgi:hypothetical protein